MLCFPAFNLIFSFRANDECLYVYNREENKRTLKVISFIYTFILNYNFIHKSCNLLINSIEIVVNDLKIRC